MILNQPLPLHFWQRWMAFPRSIKQMLQNSFDSVLSSVIPIPLHSHLPPFSTFLKPYSHYLHTVDACHNMYSPKLSFTLLPSVCAMFLLSQSHQILISLVMLWFLGRGFIQLIGDIQASKFVLDMLGFEDCDYLFETIGLRVNYSGFGLIGSSLTGWLGFLISSILFTFFSSCLGKVTVQVCFGSGCLLSFLASGLWWLLFRFSSFEFLGTSVNLDSGFSLFSLLVRFSDLYKAGFTSVSLVYLHCQKYNSPSFLSDFLNNIR